MKTFEFVAFDQSGKKRAGAINAWSLSEAKRKIQQKGFYLASIKIQDGSGVAIKRDGSDERKLSADINRGSHGKCQPVALTHRNCGNQENQSPFSFFKELKRFFFSDGKVGV
jgi:hypothetical protein